MFQAEAQFKIIIIMMVEHLWYMQQVHRNKYYQSRELGKLLPISVINYSSSSRPPFVKTQFKRNLRILKHIKCFKLLTG
jgi:hypothetical protein